MKVYAIRGAVTADRNTEEEIAARSVELISAIAERNKDISSIVSVVVSTTDDLTASYPAKAIRESGILPSPIFSCKEPSIDGALAMCIRLLVTVCSENDKAEAKHVYLGGAKALRKDLTDES